MDSRNVCTLLSQSYVAANPCLVDDEPLGNYPEESELCMTPACVHAASEVLYNLSPQYKELDPCDDYRIVRRRSGDRSTKKGKCRGRGAELRTARILYERS